MTSEGSFVGRRKEIEQLRNVYAEGRHVLIVGPAGIGKTALLRYAQSQLRLIVCEETSSLRRICESLERHLGWTHRKMNVVERKNRLLPYLGRRGEPVALDAVSLTPPRVARFIQNLIERIPVWIACRSLRPKEMVRFGNICIISIVSISRPFVPPIPLRWCGPLSAAGRVFPSTANHIQELHLVARGNPRALEELLVELSTRDYNLDDSFDRKLLDLDRRIRHAAGLAAAQIEV